MRLLIQRVLEANVKVEGKSIAEIDRGLLIFVGMGKNDNEASVKKGYEKLKKLRIFEDENGKTNLDSQQVNASLLFVSQFTLWANLRGGNRPSFIESQEPTEAARLFDYLVSLALADGFFTKKGEFGADMKVGLVNDGPFTIWYDTEA